MEVPLNDVVLGEAYETGQALDTSVRFLDRVIDALAEYWKSQSFVQVLQAFINLRRFFEHSRRGRSCLINLFVQWYSNTVRTTGDTAVGGRMITKEEIEVLEEIVSFLEDDAEDLGMLTKALMLQKIGHFEGQARGACAYHAHGVKEACYKADETPRLIRPESRSTICLLRRCGESPEGERSGSSGESEEHQSMRVA
ncbi:hypothetical protein LTR78_008978 [Recurvomyces mirabilis]|uniref:Uncharacterized protein n=1 Tax=Recurvomyces mirabilis TaxID=574656 RepID=A0AAE0TPB3_9PEZI|nr:hypothetical protein LTR78_008978 [Recurvomyces mirabilis]